MYAHLSSIRKRVLALHNSHTKLHSWKVEAKVTINHPRHWRVCHYRDLISWRNGHWQASCSKCYDLEQVLLKTTIYHHHHHQPVSGGSRDTWRVSTVPWMVSILIFFDWSVDCWSAKVHSICCRCWLARHNSTCFLLHQYQQDRSQPMICRVD